MKHPRDFDLVYLATPYSKYEKGLEMAFVDAACLAGRLMMDGYKIYSPIAHTHPLSRYANIDPLNHDIWLPFDESMMRASEALVVALMPGWDKSYGIQHEIKFFAAAGKPVYMIDPVTLQVTHLEPEAAAA